MTFSLGVVAYAVVGANTSVAGLVVMGVIATWTGIWDKQGISDLGKLVFHMSMPALVFTKVVEQISIEHLKTLWVLPVSAVLHVVSAYVIMSGVNRVLRLSTVEARATAACMMFGNCGSLAMAVVHSLCDHEPMKTLFDGKEHCEVYAVADCAFYVIAWNILIWGVGDVLLFSEEEDESVGTPNSPRSPAAEVLPPAPKVSQDARTVGSLKRAPLLGSVPALAPASPEPHFRRVNSEEHLIPFRRIRSEEHIPCGSNEDGAGVGSTGNFFRARRGSVHYLDSKGIKQERSFEVKLTTTAVKEVVSRIPMTNLYAQCYMDKNAGSERSSISELSRKPSRANVLTSKMKKRCRSLCSTFKQFAKSPAIRAATLAVVFGVIPQTKALFVGDNPPLRFLMTGLTQLGDAQVPVSLIMLSGSGTLSYIDKMKKNAQRCLEADIGKDVEVASFHFSPVATVLMLFGRLLIMPFVGYFWWRALVCSGFWPAAASEGFEYGDGMLAFIMLLESCVPTAQTIVTMFIVHGDLLQGGAIAELVLVQYAIAIVLYSVAVAAFEVLAFGDV